MQIQENSMTYFKPKWQLKSKLLPQPNRRWCHTSIIYKNCLYILGGRLPQSAKSRQYIYRINLQTYQCQQIYLSNQHITMMRESHSLSLIGDAMYVLFGMNKHGKILHDCLKLDITSTSLILTRKQQKPKIEPKQSHMSTVISNQYILIYGGINAEEKQCDEFYLYDVKDQIWRKINIVEYNNGIKGLDVKVGGVMLNVKGKVYLFGGEKNQGNEYSNNVYQIDLKGLGCIKDINNNNNNQLKVIITKLQPPGPLPLSRSQFASAVYKQRYLIIIGGQCQNKQKNIKQPTPANFSSQLLASTPSSTSPSNSTLLNDIWSFDTQRNIWQQIIPTNPLVFKPRSSFTACVYKQSLIIFGGLVSLKDFKVSDQLFMLELNTDSDKKPVCNICKTSYRQIKRIQTGVEYPVSKISENHYATGYSTIYRISRMISQPFQAIGTFIHSLSLLSIKQCQILLTSHTISFTLPQFPLTFQQFSFISHFYDFIPLIQQCDQRIMKTLKYEIRKIGLIILDII